MNQPDTERLRHGGRHDGLCRQGAKVGPLINEMVSITLGADIGRPLKIMMLGLRGFPSVQGGVENHVMVKPDGHFVLQNKSD